jgi:hypothetical protein
MTRFPAEKDSDAPHNKLLHRSNILVDFTFFPILAAF